MPRAVLSHQPGDGHLSAGRSAGLILRDCVTRSEPAAEQCDAVAAWDVSERRTDAPPVNEKGHSLSADVDIHALPLELEGSELAGLRMFAGNLDGDVLVMCLAISYLRLAFNVVGHSVGLGVDTDKRRGLWVVVV